MRFLQGKHTPYWVNGGLFIITLILSLNISFSPDDWKELTDPFDYLRQSKMSVLDKEFYFPPKADGNDSRPFTVPLFYKICRSNPVTIVQMQKFMLSLSVFCMIAAFMMFLEKNSAKYLLMICIYLLAGWWNVLGWCILLLSESLSTSFLFLWLASFLFLYKKPSAWRWLLHAAITILFAFTRDSWPYVLLLFYAAFCLLWLLTRQRGAGRYAALFALSVVIFLVQQAGTRIGLRYKLPVINSIVVRILPDSGYTEWFVKNGMPCAAKLQRNFGSLGKPGNVAFNDDSAYQIWDLYADTAYQPFLDWVSEKGQSVYTRFLITHPRFFFLTGESKEQLSRIMSYNLYYIDEPRGYSNWIEPLFPIFNITAVVLLCIILLIVYYYTRSAPILLAPVILLLFSILNALLSYNADALEVKRHLFITNILVQLIGFWAVVLIWDEIPLSQRLNRFKE